MKPTKTLSFLSELGKSGYRRFMNYAEYRSHGSPIGSSIAESACKQIVTERLKLSGMR